MGSWPGVVVLVVGGSVAAVVGGSVVAVVGGSVVAVVRVSVVDGRSGLPVRPGSVVVVLDWVAAGRFLRCGRGAERESALAGGGTPGRGCDRRARGDGPSRVAGS